MASRKVKMLRQVLAVAPLIVIIFQNCAEHFSPRREIASTSIISGAFAEKEIIIRLKNQGARDELLNWSVSHGMTHEHEWPDIHTHHFSWTENASVDEMLSEVYSLMPSDVSYAEPNYSFKKLDIGDDLQILASGTVTANASSVQTTAPIQFKETWPTLAVNGTRPIVAVIDSGIDLSHSVFVNSNALWRNTQEVPNNGIDDDSNGFVDDINGWDFANNDNNPSDDQGHGTHVAGIVLGTGQNIFGTTQVPAKIQIMALKFLTAAGDGKTSDAIQAVYYAVKNGAKVINNSWGGAGYSRTLIDAIAYAYSNKVLFVAAAGNDGRNIDGTPMYPASYMVPNVLPVAATNSTDQLTSFSNFGALTVQIAAPGASILSTYPNNQFATLSGTSMATPFVAGTAALMAYERPQMTSYQIRTILTSQVDQINGLTNFVWGKGRLNVLKATTFAKSAILDTDQPSYSLASQSKESSPSGCGMVISSGPKPPDGNSWAAVLILLFPVIVAIISRNAPITLRVDA
ncbi:MAG: hypothetical protein A4S09_11015 [Proteobacteria bacterium SG_bin7]|nr:MAG: hypothetical protein A4S09_11015 [Proteobacteria bacterium SG_bin7]